jgi:glycosyltransferase involved in cell wall biosynthesis
VTQPARVALVVAQTAGGIGRHVSSLVPELVERGAEVTFIAPTSARRFSGEDSGARFMELDIPRGISPVGAYSAFTKLVRLLRGQDIVHAHGIRAGFLSGIAVKRARVPHSLTTIHNAVLEEGWHRHPAARLADWMTASSSEKTIYVSKALARMASSRRLRTGSVVVIPAGADLSPVAAEEADTARRGLGVAIDRKLIVSVGRLHPLKGFNHLIQAAARMTDPAEVIIAGDGPARTELEELVERLRVSDRVRLLGEREDARALIAAADVFCLPSLSEGSPLALQEALGAGAVIVTTSVEGILETLGSREAALVVPPGDVAALAAALDRSLRDDGLRGRLGETARLRASEIPDSRTVASRIADLYEELLGRRLGPTGRPAKGLR